MIPTVGRVRLVEVGTFAPSPDRWARVSLVWWDPDEPEGRRDPVLVAQPGGAVRTFVAVWPTDGRGLLDGARLGRGEVDVLPWDLGPEALEELRRRHARWPLDLHDLRVSGTPSRPRLGPCPETLRTAPIGAGLDRHLERAQLAA